MTAKSKLFDIIKDDLIRHEGYKREIYMCPAGLPTFGVGHMIRKDDIEANWPVGTPVTEERINAVFEEDFLDALEDAESLVDGLLYTHPDGVARVLVNMAFNIGRGRLSKFKNMLAAINNYDYKKAADEMEDSRWYHQVGHRSKELVNVMRFETAV